MADVALIVVAVDSLWRRQGHIPPADRTALQLAALDGLPLVLVTSADEAALREVAWMLRMDPIGVVGPTRRTELRGRLLSESQTAESVLDRLAEELSRAPLPFSRRDILAIGGDESAAEWLAAAGLSAWVASTPGETPCDYLTPDGLAQAVGELAMRNNRFLRPGAGAGQTFRRL
ncbi:MAG: hypothetical protein HUU35_19195 [Armatimonadetes bacterium]|nr:hypothetical protein [Armatimonadota bacterium]